LDKQGKKLSDKVFPHVVDVTGGRIVSILERANRIIAEAPHSEEGAADAVRAISTLYDSSRLPAPRDLLQPFRANYVVSSGVSSVILEGDLSLLRLIKRKYWSKGIAAGHAYQDAHDAMIQRVFKQHAETLAFLVKDNGRVYWSDTMVQTGNFSKLKSFEEYAFSRRLAETIRLWDWRNLISSAGKMEMARWLEPINGRRYSPDDIDTLLFKFNVDQPLSVELIPVMIGIVAMAYQSLEPTMFSAAYIAHDTIVSLVRMIAQTMEPFPETMFHTLPTRKGLAPLIDVLFKPESQGNWFWMIHPNDVLRGLGGVYKIEAYILEKTSLRH
jgi:hypothetical protein